MAEEPEVKSEIATFVYENKELRKAEEANELESIDLDIKVHEASVRLHKSRLKIFKKTRELMVARHKEGNAAGLSFKWNAVEKSDAS